jgi:peptidoglycan/xylan/chitin deacetylase (PgdA/CDA1 family)
MIDRHLRRQLRRPHRWLADRPRRRGAVLMYHGIGEPGIDPWGLFVSSQHFSEHLEVLAEMATPLPLDELVESAVDDALPPRSVALTFDDGYANVAHRAQPILADHGVPATLFVVSEPLSSAAEYWWDELAALLLEPGELPPRLELRTPGAAVELAIGSAEHHDRDAWIRDHDYRDGDGVASPRMELYRRLWEHLAPVEHGARQQAIDELADWAGRPRSSRDSHRSLTVDELVELDGDTVTIGGHTSTHPLLPGLAPDRLRTEIEDGKRCLEERLGREITTFSYPFGANDPAAVEMTRRVGYRLAVTARPETVLPGVDPFRVGRFDVKDWDGNEFERRLRRWFRYR